MRIPDKVRIGGLEYTVRRVQQTGLELQAEGTISPRELMITICDTGTEYAKVTFLHECVHGMLEAIGIPCASHHGLRAGKSRTATWGRRDIRPDGRIFRRPRTRFSR